MVSVVLLQVVNGPGITFEISDNDSISLAITDKQHTNGFLKNSSAVNIFFFFTNTLKVFDFI